MTSPKPAEADSPPVASVSPVLAMSALPTLQRNALRKIFERPNFTPEDVARLGYRRLQQAEGIGQKGLNTIIAWLRDFGYELQPTISTSGEIDQNSPKRARKKIEFALRILRNNGYVAYRRGSGSAGND